MNAATASATALLILILITFSSTENDVYTLASIASPNMKIENIHTEPPSVHVGDYFILNATIKNISNDTISVLNFGCKGPIKSLFNENIEVEPATSGICFNPQQIITLSPGESVDSLAPDSTESYKAIHEGIVEAVLQIDYNIQTNNQTSIAGNGSTYAGFLSEPFTFEVLAPNK
jgi:hypothetical protein